MLSQCVERPDNCKARVKAGPRFRLLAFPAPAHRLFRRMSFYDQLKFNADGLIPWMNRASLETTLATGRTHFWSRSRKKFWMKGESSGHVQIVRDLAFDCDGDTLLIQVDQTGAACHEGYKSCFYRSVSDAGNSIKVTESQLQTPEDIYGKK
jgi:phosphoribosyl-AMP cyclohydrolase